MAFVITFVCDTRTPDNRKRAREHRVSNTSTFVLDATLLAGPGRDMPVSSLLEQLGKLKESGALSEEHFKSLKGLVLENDASVSEQSLTTLAEYWDLRTRGVLDDGEYHTLLLKTVNVGDTDARNNDDGQARKVWGQRGLTQLRSLRSRICKCGMGQVA